MTNERKRLADYLMSGRLEGVRFRYEGEKGLFSQLVAPYEYTVKEIGTGRGVVSLWINTPSEVETGSQEKRVSLYNHLCDLAIN